MTANKLLYDATTTYNIGFEVGLKVRSTLNVVYGLNPWKFDSDRHGERSTLLHQSEQQLGRSNRKNDNRQLQI